MLELDSNSHFPPPTGPPGGLAEWDRPQGPPGRPGASRTATATVSTGSRRWLGPHLSQDQHAAPLVKIARIHPKPRVAVKDRSGLRHRPFSKIRPEVLGTWDILDDVVATGPDTAPQVLQRLQLRFRRVGTIIDNQVEIGGQVQRAYLRQYHARDGRIQMLRVNSLFIVNHAILVDIEAPCACGK